MVEDEALVGMELEEGLVQLGFRVPEVVTRGEEVVEAVQRLNPDLVLMDIRIAGGVDGIEAAARVRRVSDVPLVFLTACNDAHTLARAAEVRPEGFLIKPFGDQDLAAVVARVLRPHQDPALG